MPRNGRRRLSRQWAPCAERNSIDLAVEPGCRYLRGYIGTPRTPRTPTRWRGIGSGYRRDRLAGAVRAGGSALLRSSWITVLLADQNADAALRLADRAYVMETGRVVATGVGAELVGDARLRRSYPGIDISKSRELGGQ